MKKTLITIAAFAMMLLGTDVFAQGKYGRDSAECIKYLSYYKEYYKQKSYTEAIPNWRKAYSICPPTANQTMLVDGAALLRKLISTNSKDILYRNALVDSLLAIHDVRAQYYPKYAVTAYNNKGLDMANYLKDDNRRLYDEYRQIIEFNRENTKPQLYLFYLNAAISLFQEGELGGEEVIDAYETSIGYLSNAPAKNDSETEQIANVRTDMETMFVASRVASCEKILEIYGPRLDADPQNGELAGKIVKMMSSDEDCMSEDLFLRAATTMYNTNPSSASAYFVYKLNARNGNVNEAIKYIQEAIDKVVPEDERSKYDLYLELATFQYKLGNLNKAIEAAKKAADQNEDNAVAGKAYMLIGTIWGATRCEGDEIAKRAPYWVAVDYMQKARAADSSLGEEAGKKIAEYSKYFPLLQEAFMYDISDGQSYTVSCGGLKATTTVRTQK